MFIHRLRVLLVNAITDDTFVFRIYNKKIFNRRYIIDSYFSIM